MFDHPNCDHSGCQIERTCIASNEYYDTYIEICETCNAVVGEIEVPNF